MTTSITKQFTFDAAHYLPNVPEGHKCGRMHGHTYTVRVTVEGEVDPHTGWVADFADITSAWKPLEGIFDHRVLNDIIDNPTAENLAAWIFVYMTEVWASISSVEVSETPNSWATFRRSEQ